MHKANYRLELLKTWQRQPSSPDANWAGKSVLLLGSKGLLGICALNAWLKSGAQVVALTRGEGLAFTHPNLTWLKGDLDDPKSWDAWTNIPDTVIVCAPIWLLAPVMPKLAALNVKRIVAFSSTSVHTKGASGSAEERKLADVLRSSEESVFAAGKANNIGVTILRPTLIYGIGMDRNVTTLARVIRKLPALPLPLDAGGLRAPVHAIDLAAATLAAAANPNAAGKAYDVGGGERIAYRVMLERIAAALPKKILLIPVPLLAHAMDGVSALRRQKNPSYGEIVRRMKKDQVFDDSAARSDFGWSPRAFLDAARQPADTPFF